MSTQAGKGKPERKPPTEGQSAASKGKRSTGESSASQGAGTRAPAAFGVSAKELIQTGLLLAAAVATIAGARPRSVEGYEAVHTLNEVYALPDPEQLKVLSLGYRSALADLLFGQTLVAAGMHFSEHKVFEQLDGYLNAIVALEQKYRDVYYYADSLLTLSTVVMPKRNYRLARELQERGLKLFPDDAQLWMSAGQFMTYLAVQWLPEDEDRDEWRRAGIDIIQHACAIWPYSDLPASCLGAASVLSRLGETEATIRSLERLVAVADDPQVRAEAIVRLEMLLGEQARERFRHRLSALTTVQMGDLPILSRTAYQLVGPPADVDSCIGRGGASLPPTCATSFAAVPAELELTGK